MIADGCILNKDCARIGSPLFRSDGNILRFERFDSAGRYPLNSQCSAKEDAVSPPDYPAWAETNPDQGVVNILYYLAAAMIAVWTLGIGAIIIAAFRYPAAF